MRPETVHLLVTLVRHGRGVLNAIEKFERTVPKDERASEIATVIDFVREELADVDRTLYASLTHVSAAR